MNDEFELSSYLDDVFIQSHLHENPISSPACYPENVVKFTINKFTTQIQCSSSLARKVKVFQLFFLGMIKWFPLTSNKQ